MSDCSLATPSAHLHPIPTAHTRSCLRPTPAHAYAPYTCHTTHAAHAYPHAHATAHANAMPSYHIKPMPISALMSMLMPSCSCSFPCHLNLRTLPQYLFVSNIYNKKLKRTKQTKREHPPCLLLRRHKQMFI